MAKEVWIVEGLGDENPKMYSLRPSETVNDIRCQFAEKFGVSASEVEVSTDTKRLTNGGAKLSGLVKDGDTLHITPRAKAG